MFRFSSNYYDRICYFEREQVPTQSIMIKKMQPPLAKVYFNSMTPKLKVLAGLEPPLKGGGADWYIPPKSLLEERRVVLKPVKKEHLLLLGFNGINLFGNKILKDHHRAMEEEKRLALLENDIQWKWAIAESCRKQYVESSEMEAEANTKKIQEAFLQFASMYRISITKLEDLLFDAAIKEIERVREEAYQKMLKHYKTLVKQQATMLYDRFTDKLMMEKARLKSQFMEQVEIDRTVTDERLHDSNVEKHVAVEKLRNLLECQKLACQVYVALKEREECAKEIDTKKRLHRKRVHLFTETIAMKDFEIRLGLEQQLKRQEFNRIWKKKICHVVKTFQIFVKYCLKLMPQHAEFFINMEKLMLLQLDEASENPSAVSVFVSEDKFHTPVPRPHPFFLFCDKGYKPQLDQDLCPKHCTSSASQLPVIIVNKRCIYAACDNFEKYTDKVTRYIHGERGNDIDLQDDHDYTFDIPVKYQTSQKLQELKLESSLMQILQNELPNVKELPIECCVCKIPYCFCSPLHASKMSLPRSTFPKEPSLPSISSGSKIETRSVELELEREPKWESYLDYLVPKKCKCAKTAKKHLKEHLPAYMRNMSIFDAPDLPNYETCPLPILKKLVKKARGKRTPPPEPPILEPKVKDVSTQCSDAMFEYLCDCFSDDEISRLFKELIKDSKMFDKTLPLQCAVVDGSVSSSHLGKTVSTFVTDRAMSLRALLDEQPELEEIFKKKDCNFD